MFSQGQTIWHTEFWDFLSCAYIRCPKQDRIAFIMLNDVWRSIKISLVRLYQYSSVMSNSLWPNGLYSPWNSLGQNTGVEAFPFSSEYSQPRDLTQVCHIAGGIFCQLSRRARLRTLEWAAYPFSSRSSWPRNLTRVSCIAGGFFTNLAIREGSNSVYVPKFVDMILQSISSGFLDNPGLKIVVSESYMDIFIHILNVYNAIESDCI